MTLDATSMRIGILGCGDVCDLYRPGLHPFTNLDVVACADLDAPRAARRAAEFGARACAPHELLAASDVELVLNLTPPLAHASLAIAAIGRGKHVYGEKPLATNVEDGRAVIDAAERHAVRVGCAPDTFLGGAAQTCRKLIDDGAIGTPVAAFGFVLLEGHEGWHPDPRSYYADGGGPMLDMGPYYLTTLISLLGPVRSVAGITGRAPVERTIASGPLSGTHIPVDVDTNVAGTVEFASGVIGTIATSYDVFGGTTLPPIEIHGTEASLLVPDPNGHAGRVQLRPAGAEAWTDVPLTHDRSMLRGIGVADMVESLGAGRPHRASAALALHVLETMSAFTRSAVEGRHVHLETTCERPAPLPVTT